MTDAELDGKCKIDESRMKRIARGSGSLIIEVQLLLEEYKKYDKNEIMKGILKENKRDFIFKNSPTLSLILLGFVSPIVLKLLQNILNTRNCFWKAGNLRTGL